MTKISDTMPEMVDYYLRGGEAERLSRSQGSVEFERTKEILCRHFPAAPSTVADIGGGPGRYTCWLASLGYRVILQDVMPLHVEQAAQATAGSAHVEVRVGDARHLDLADESVDAVLLLGPLYHLEHRGDRLQALDEAYRIVRPGGYVFVAAISRWVGRLNMVLGKFPPEVMAVTERSIDGVDRTGRFPALVPGGFCGYGHRPNELVDEVVVSGFELVDLVAVEGIASILGDSATQMDDPNHRRIVLGAIRATERVPEMLGISAHLLATARRPDILCARSPGSQRETSTT